MRQAMWCGVLACGLAVGSMSAQMAMGTQQQSVGGNQSVMAAMMQPVTGEPYQAQKISRSVQTLSDGTVITHESKGLIARDAEGRVREDLYLVHSGQVNGKEGDLTLQSATVGDPVAHTMLIWTDEKAKIAMQMDLPSLHSKLSGGVTGVIASAPPPPPPPAPGSLPSAVSLGTASGAGLAAGDAKDKDQVRTEELGQQSIEGTLVTGKRITTTIPTGKVGNDRPLAVVHEEWRSPELKILVKTIDTDPRTGEQTMELQQLVRTDPEATLFQAPAGYKVRDMAQMLKVLGNIGRPKTQ